MTRLPRRTVLKGSAAAVGGLLAGPTIVGASSSEDRYIVDTKNVSQGDLEGADVEVIHDLDEVNLAVVRGTESDVEDIGGDFAAEVEYDIGLPADGKGAKETKDERWYELQWDKQAQDIAQAHNVARGGGIRVGVVDSGVDPGHPDLEHAINDDLSENVTGDGGFTDAPDYADVQFHGTHVSGIIAADDENDYGVVGSAPAVDLVAYRIFPKDSPDGFGFGTMIAGMVRSVNDDCDVMNLSLGAFYPMPRQGASLFVRVLNRVTSYAKSNGTLIVAAAGNDGADLQHDKNYIKLPTEAANVMTVSATGPVGFNWGDEGVEKPPHTPAFYTNYGTNVIDVSAPGGNVHRSFYDGDPDTKPPDGFFWDWVLSTFPGGSLGLVSGTSMAAPQVSGAAALVKSVDSSLNPNQIRQTIERTAADKGKKGKDPYHGSGFVDPVAAVEDARKKGNGKGKGN